MANRRNSGLRCESVEDLDCYLDWLRQDEDVDYVEVNSTLSRKYQTFDRAVEAPTVLPLSSDMPLVGGGNCRGKALLICNRFLQTRYEREGWDKEVRHAEAVFQQLGFELAELVLDKTGNEIITAVQSFSQSPGHGELVGLAIMSHGDEQGDKGNVLGNDGVSSCSVQSIVEAVSVPELKDVSKLCFLSFCRGTVGNQYNRAAHTWESKVLPSLLEYTNLNMALSEMRKSELDDAWAVHPFPSVKTPENCYICYSTLPDSRSVRGMMFDTLDSTLQSIYKTRSSGQNSARRDLLSILTAAAGAVREKSGGSQYLNLCYRLTSHTKPLLVDVVQREHSSHFSELS